MGCYNIKCAVSNLNICAYDEIVMFFIDKAKIYYQGIEFSDRPDIIRSPYVIISEPIYGKYNDYGFIENVENKQIVYRGDIYYVTDGNIKVEDTSLRNDGEYRKDRLYNECMFVHRKIFDFLYEEVNNNKFVERTHYYNELIERIESIRELSKKGVFKNNYDHTVLYPIFSTDYTEMYKYKDFIDQLYHSRFYLDSGDVNDESFNDYYKHMCFYDFIKKIYGPSFIFNYITDTYIQPSHYAGQEYDLKIDEKINKISKEIIQSRKEEWGI